MFMSDSKAHDYNTYWHFIMQLVNDIGIIQKHRRPSQEWPWFNGTNFMCFGILSNEHVNFKNKNSLKYGI